MKLIETAIKNKVLASMGRILDENRAILMEANKKDLEVFDNVDRAMYDRLIVDEKKIDSMIRAIAEVRSQADPVGCIISSKELESGLKVLNTTAPFGTILIIYESRPDVTVEAATLAFKSNNRIVLKGGKEAVHSNTTLVQFWHKALSENNVDVNSVQLLTMNRQQTQEFLKHPTEKIDLIVPRGGEKLIEFVKTHATCPVLVSGRGNNFLYVDEAANWEKSIKVILNAKTQKISACNALDKILIHSKLPNYANRLKRLENILTDNGVAVEVDKKTKSILKEATPISNEATWYEEFLDMKCCIGTVDTTQEAIEKINIYSGGHSATIMTTNTETTKDFMEQVDCAAVYQNASTRFTDGGAMGVGAELAISTDKLHHRGPLGLDELVTNKYCVFGDGHVRE